MMRGGVWEGKEESTGGWMSSKTKREAPLLAHSNAIPFPIPDAKKKKKERGEKS